MFGFHFPTLRTDHSPERLLVLLFMFGRHPGTQANRQAAQSSDLSKRLFSEHGAQAASIDF